MKKILVIFLLGIFLYSCDNDDDGIQNGNTPDPTTNDVTVQNFMWQAMNLWYFWQDQVPDLADTRFSTDQEYTEFLQSENDPETFLRSLLFQDDRFTFWNEDFEVLLNSLSGISRNNGLQFFIIDLTEDDTNNLFGFVRNVIPGSDAANKGMQRGDVFYAVDGQILTADNFNELLFGDNATYTLSIGELDVANRLVLPTVEEITLTKEENFQEDPIRLATTLDINGQKIGYLMYRQFNSNFNGELNDAFGQFVADGVTDLVLDMRYNGGGSVNTSRLLASMIYGTNTNDLYIRQRWNSKIQPQISDENLNDFFANVVRIPDPNDPDETINEPLNSLNLNRVYVLGTDRTASASELVMNGLDPYIEVIHIGSTTRGKNEFSISLVDNPDNSFIYSSSTEAGINPENRWIIQPLVGRNENAVGFFDYTAGFPPDVALDEDVFNLGTFGDPNEPMLARAIEAITNASSKATSQSRFQEPLGYQEFDTPEMELMILDKPVHLGKQ
ncbi:MAG: S41 family peptidase [Bacteroidota bacterium]